MAVAAAAGMMANQAEAVHLDAGQLDLGQYEALEGQQQQFMLAQTQAQAEAGAEAEAMYFKDFVNFAKDAINTIAPALSSKNR